MEFRKLFDDGAAAVVIKPRGIDCERDLPALVGGDVFLVHRLDRETAGLLVIARTSADAAALSRAVTEGRLTKEYTAVVCGTPVPPAGELRDLLFHDRVKNKTYVVSRRRAGVKEAVLTYETVGTAQTASGPETTVQIRLLTGRTHQIRAQFAHLGCPLAGDGKYGGGKGEFRLTSVRLSFPHPRTGEIMTFTLPGGDA